MALWGRKKIEINFFAFEMKGEMDVFWLNNKKFGFFARCISTRPLGRKRVAGQKSGQSWHLCGRGYFCLDFFYLFYQEKRLKVKKEV